MEKEKFIKLMMTIVIEERWQTLKAKFIKSCLEKEIRAIQALGKAVGVEITANDIVTIIPELSKDTLESMTGRA